jgi:oligopeptide transport system permease protein
VKRFLARRLLLFAVTLWAVVTLAFALLRAAPGGPFAAERSLPPEIEAGVRERYHLDWPLWRQYLQTIGPLNLDERGLAGDRTRVFGGLLALDFGPSLRYRDHSVGEVIAESLPISLSLGLAALALAVAVGLAAGITAAMRPGGKADAAVRAWASLTLALPNFALAGISILVLCFALPLLPVAGYGSLRHLVLPSLALGLPCAATIARLTRTGLVEALSQDYVRTAYAKGATRWRVVVHHALPPALLPVVSYLGPAAAGVLSGSLVVERVFAIPGLGSHFVGSALSRDYTLAIGVTVVYAALVFAGNLLVDVAYALLDPRIEVEA